MSRRIIPVQTVERHLERAHGVRGQGYLEREIAATRRLESRERILLPRTYVFHRDNIGASGDAAYLLRVGHPSGSTAWSMSNLPLRMPASGRIVGADLYSSEARTGGTATARVRVTEGGVNSDYDFPDCQLNATYTQTVACVHWDQAPRFASGATLDPRVVTASTWAPTTADVTMILSVVFELV